MLVKTAISIRKMTTTEVRRVSFVEFTLVVTFDGDIYT